MLHRADGSLFFSRPYTFQTGRVIPAGSRAMADRLIGPWPENADLLGESPEQRQISTEVPAEAHRDAPPAAAAVPELPEVVTLPPPEQPARQSGEEEDLNAPVDHGDGTFEYKRDVELDDPPMILKAGTQLTMIDGVVYGPKGEVLRQLSEPEAVEQAANDQGDGMRWQNDTTVFFTKPCPWYDDRIIEAGSRRVGNKLLAPWPENTLIYEWPDDDQTQPQEERSPSGEEGRTGSEGETPREQSRIQDKGAALEAAPGDAPVLAAVPEQPAEPAPAHESPAAPTPHTRAADGSSESPTDAVVWSQESYDVFDLTDV